MWFRAMPTGERRVVVYHDRLSTLPSLRAMLERDGHTVCIAHVLQDAAGFCMHYQAPLVLVVQLPDAPFLRQAVLDSLRRIAPTVPILALVATNGAEINRDASAARISCVLSSTASPDEVTEAVGALFDGGPLPMVTDEDSDEGIGA